MLARVDRRSHPSRGGHRGGTAAAAGRHRRVPLRVASGTRAGRRRRPGQRRHPPARGRGRRCVRGVFCDGLGRPHRPQVRAGVGRGAVPVRGEQRWRPRSTCSTTWAAPRRSARRPLRAAVGLRPTSTSPARSPSCSAARPTGSPGDRGRARRAASPSPWRAHRVAQRGHGRHRSSLRSRRAAAVRASAASRRTERRWSCTRTMAVRPAALDAIAQAFPQAP